MITVENNRYEIIRDERGGFDLDAFKEKYTEYFESYDYIVGDWAYGKLRLKGFNDKNNPKLNKINDASTIDSYIENYCAYGCKYFILKRINIA